MKIAVTFDGKNNVFEHFGKTEQFIIYEVEDGIIKEKSLLESGGTGHEALATLLKDNGVDTLICSGIGKGAIEALIESGIEVMAGAEGDTDECVLSYIRGTLENTGANCSHDHEEGCSGHCGHDTEEGCTGGCNGCSGCHGPSFEGKNVGKTLRVHYTGTFNDGTKFDSSYDRNEPLEFVCGAGMMILGFDKAVADMEAGEIKDIHLLPSEAYGEYDPSAVFSTEISRLPGSEELTVGQKVYLRDVYGRPVPVTVISKDETQISFDTNHEMAGKELNFRIELVEIL